MGAGVTPAADGRGVGAREMRDVIPGREPSGIVTPGHGYDKQLVFLIKQRYQNIKQKSLLELWKRWPWEACGEGMES